MTAESINTLAQTALNIERIGIVGILCVISGIFIYLYLKQVKENTQELKGISEKLSQTLDFMQEYHKQLLDKLIQRESRFRRNDD